ncbi:hypothetical protein [Achromobacter phage ewik_TL4]|nr:hypothetical protein [Achromobacter phage ewik_TL4]
MIHALRTNTWKRKWPAGKTGVKVCLSRLKAGKDACIGNDMDYKTLLEKYVRHVLESEGSTFLPPEWFFMSDVVFTEEEVKELNTIDERVKSRHA